MANQTEAEVLLLGPCKIEIDGVDMGYTGPAGAKVIPSYKFTESKVGKFGDAALDFWMNMIGLEIDVDFAQTNFAVLAKVYPGGTKVTSGAASKLTLGQIAGTKLVPFLLKLTPLNAPMATSYSFTSYRTVSIGAPELIYDGSGVQYYKSKLRCLVDDTKTDGNWFATFGDTTINADVTPPTVSSVTPADNAGSVSTATTVVWVFSKAMDINSVDNGSASLQLSPVSVGIPTALGVAGTLGLSVDGLTLTFTPAVALTAGKTYIPRLSTKLKDLAGNRLGGGLVDGLAGYLTDFAT